jgi:hypothetical protein
LNHFKLQKMKNLLPLALFAFLTSTVFAQKITFSSDVASIIYSNCTSCHRQGSIAPFSLENYKDAFDNRFAIANAVQNKIMPPWSPDPSYSRFCGERKLTNDQINAITKWVSDGAEEGAIAEEPKEPVFNDLSQLENPEFSQRCKVHTVHNTLDEFAFFTIPSGLTKDAMIKQIELVPGNRKIVHHIFVFIDSTGQFSKFIQNDSFKFQGNNYISGGIMNSIKLIGGWLPGGSYYTVPDNLAFRVPKNSYYIVQIHYAPGSAGKSDSTQLNIKYTGNAVAMSRTMSMKPLLDNVRNLTNGPLYIPANTVKIFREEIRLGTDSFTGTSDISLISVTPHMHLIGKRLKVYALDPNNVFDTLRLIDDRWNFHWQGMYTFPKMIHIKKNWIIYAEGTYDNTDNNPDNPNNPLKDIIAGTSTLTEMMQVFFCWVPYQPGDENISLGTVTSDPTAIQNPKDAIADFQMYPDPSTSGGNLRISLLVPSVFTVSIYAADGKQIENYGAKNFDGNVTLKLPDMPKGLYFVKLTGDKSMVTKKLLIE